MSELEHDPDAVLDYSWDWDDWLDDAETITNHSISVNPVQTAEGIVIESSDIYIGARKVVAWISGGVLNTAVDVTCHILTSEGREDDRTHNLWVMER